MNVVELEASGALALRAAGEEYLVQYPVRAVIELEKKLGRNMHEAAGWFKTETHELPDILQAGLRKNHGDESAKIAEIICDAIATPERIGPVVDALCALNFPEAMRRYKEALAELEAKVKAGASIPNVQSADAN